jgi:hypothetical protein
VKGAPAALFALYLALRALLLLEPGYRDDLVAYRRWAMTAVEHGLPRLYTESDFDYPPLYAYALLPLGKAYVALSPGAGTRRGGDPLVWNALAKLPPLAFDLLTAWLLWRLGAANDRDAVGWRLWLPGAYLANPAVVFDTGYWGHPDSIHSFFVLLAFVLAARGRGILAFTSLTLASLMKPLGAPFFPLLFALVLWRGGGGAVLAGVAAAAATTVLVFLPLVWNAELGSVLSRVIGDLDRMPYTSVNAHNLWGLFGGWQNAEAPLVGPLSASQIGLLLFGAAYLALLLTAWRWRGTGGIDTARATALAAGVAAAFFLLATHMHENHLFVAIPLLAATLPAFDRLRRPFVLVSLAVLLNLALHDPGIAGSWPLRLGGETDVARLSFGRHFFTAELLAVRAATLSSVLVLAFFLVGLMRVAPPPLALEDSPSDD